MTLHSGLNHPSYYHVLFWPCVAFILTLCPQTHIDQNLPEGRVQFSICWFVCMLEPSMMDEFYITNMKKLSKLIPLWSQSPPGSQVVGSST
jgi:hypothetical protein